MREGWEGNDGVEVGDWWVGGGWRDKRKEWEEEKRNECRVWEVMSEVLTVT